MTTHKTLARTLLTTLTLALLAGGGGTSLAKRRRRAPRKAEPTHGVVNINAASEAELRLLPGIGATKARRIIASRKRRKFRYTYQIIRVRGIGRRTYRRLRRYLTVKGPTTMVGKAKRPRAKK